MSGDLYIGAKKDLAPAHVGCLIGTALGDSLLLPAEGLSRRQIARRFPGRLRQRLIFGRGMVSDDTEHAFLTVQALLAAGEDPVRFAHALARRLRWWLTALPGGCGLATARGLLRSWIGIPPQRSGVRSAGNGPAMRSAIIGLRWSSDRERLRSFVTASTAITHSDERALTAALAVAEAAALITRGDPIEVLWQRWRELSPATLWQELIRILESHAHRGAEVDAVAEAIGCGQAVSGYAFHSVPIALYAWLRHRGDAEGCLTAILCCGGDTDTMGAIAGALLGADGGVEVFPPAWLADLAEWPLSVDRLRVAGQALAQPGTPTIGWYWPLQPLRNVVFLLIILGHGLRRLLP